MTPASSIEAEGVKPVEVTLPTDGATSKEGAVVSGPEGVTETVDEAPPGPTPFTALNLTA